MKTIQTDTSDVREPATVGVPIHIAYRWTRVPTRVRENQVIVALGWTQPGDDAAQSRVFSIDLPAVSEKQDTSDVSGTLGLLHPVTNDKAAARASAFERSLSDLIKWLVLHRLAVEPGAIVIIQGPMLPKLRGRFYYRGIGHINLLGLTFQPKWLAQLELVHTGSSGTFSDWELSAMYPPVQIDAGSRCWTAWRKSGLHLHFEALANLHSDGFDDSLAKRWLGIIGPILESCTESKDGLLVPKHLLAAHRAADDMLARESLTLYLQDKLDELGWDMQLLDQNPVLAELASLVRAENIHEKEMDVNPTLFPVEHQEREAASRWNAILTRKNMKGLRKRVSDRDVYSRLSAKYAALQGPTGSGT